MLLEGRIWTSMAFRFGPTKNNVDRNNGDKSDYQF
jgi:hypothetical protein